jgi:hypothetical protein
MFTTQATVQLAAQVGIKYTTDFYYFRCTLHWFLIHPSTRSVSGSFADDPFTWFISSVPRLAVPPLTVVFIPISLRSERSHE